MVSSIQKWRFQLDIVSNKLCHIFCVWWDQCAVVHFELLKPGKTINIYRNRQQIIHLNNALIEKQLEWAQRHGKVILQHDIALSHTAKLVKDTLKEFNC